MKLAVTADEVAQLAVMIGERLGLQVDAMRIDGLADVLRGRLVATGCTDVNEYMGRFARADRAREELRAIADAWTVGETYFFRNDDHMRALVQQVLPARIRARADTRRLRILSAGCASGEEPYTIEMLLHDHFREVDDWNVQIVAIDVSPSAIEKARRGTYAEWSLRKTPDDVRRRWFRQEGSSWVLSPAARSRVRFEERNLLDEDPTVWVPESFDLILCRNVTMYLTPVACEAVIAQFARALVPGGFLFLGHAESLRGVRTDFTLCHTHDTFYYSRGATVLPRGPVTPRLQAPPVAAPAEAAEPSAWFDAIGAAATRIEALTRRQPEGAQPVPEASRRAVDLALQALREERYAEGLALLENLPADAPRATRLLRAVLLVNTGALSEAERVCTSVLEGDDADAGAHYLAALCREHARDPDGARHHDEVAADLDPRFAMPHLHLGVMARRAGDNTTARREIGAAMSLLAYEDADRILLFGGGFSRDALLALCRAELRASGGAG